MPNSIDGLLAQFVARKSLTPKVEARGVATIGKQERVAVAGSFTLKPVFRDFLKSQGFKYTGKRKDGDAVRYYHKAAAGARAVTTYRGPMGHLALEITAPKNWMVSRRKKLYRLSHAGKKVYKGRK